MRKRPARFIATLACLPLVACGGDDGNEPTTDTTDTTATDTTTTDTTTTNTPSLSLARPPAPAAGSVCATDPAGVMTIERPMLPGAGSPTFGYSFKLHPGTDPDAPTVIFLPGGPGETSIQAERDAAYVPLTYPLITTDLRGTGCNAPVSVDHYPDDFYRSTAFADDVVAIVEELALDDYVLYGLSYGTLLATVVAHRLEQRGLPLPRALVLEGVLGEAFDADRPRDDIAFQERWRAVRDSLDDDIRSQLMSEPLPLGLNAEQWGTSISRALSVGASPLSEGNDYLFALLQVLAPGSGEAERAAVRSTLESFAASPIDAMSERLHHVVTCRELAEDDYESMTLQAGELVTTTYDCTDVALSEPFRASDWPVRVPIYYFSGTEDPNTPPWQALAHFEAQVTAARQLIQVEGGGHNPLLFNLGECAAPLWGAMTSGADLEGALANCSWPLRLESAPAEP